MTSCVLQTAFFAVTLFYLKDAVNKPPPQKRELYTVHLFVRCLSAASGHRATTTKGLTDVSSTPTKNPSRPVKFMLDMVRHTSCTVYIMSNCLKFNINSHSWILVYVS